MIRLDTATTEPCVWMSAGLLQYKLCQCHYDCEHCALDAAMRGIPVEIDPRFRTEAAAPRRAEAVFPADRVYATGHTWLQPTDETCERYRLGLDGFAALLIRCPRRIGWHATPRLLRAGEPLLDLEFDDGRLTFAAPAVARLIDRNRALDDHPDAIIADPYGGGWLVTLSQVEPGALQEMAAAPLAIDRARLDLRRLRRRMGVHLMANDDARAIDAPTDGEVFADPLHALGGVGYLGLVQEVLH